MAERPTPASIAISTLIALYVDPSSPLEDDVSGESKQMLLNRLHRMVRTPHHLTVTQLLNQIEDTSASEILIESLLAASSSIDGLVDLMMSIQAVETDGELGTFVRKVCLGFDQLSFECMAHLWEALQSQVENHMNDEGDSSSNESWPLSPLQKQELLRLKCLTLDEAVWNQSPDDVRIQVEALLEQEHEIPAAHFLKFLTNIQRGNKTGALDALHQYFDYAMIAERKDMKRQVVLHYATLLLAAVYQEFGDTELSRVATEEAIHIAQQSGDPACVAHALSFLYQSTGASNKNSRNTILQRCAVRALQGKLRPMVAGANMTLAQAAAPSLPAAWNSLQDATTDQPSQTMDRPTHMEDLASAPEALEILGKASLVGAGIWDSLGFVNLAGLNTEMALECYGRYLPSATKDSAVQSLARKALVGPILEESPLCRYGLALTTVMHQSNAYGTLLLLHEWAVRRGEYGHAETLIQVLYSRLHPRIPNYEDAKIEVVAQHAFLLARQGWIVKAKKSLEELVEQCSVEKEIVQQGHLLIQLAVALLDANILEFRSAVHPVRACLKLAMENSMDVMHATATSLMAIIHYRLSKTQNAIAMLKGVLPTLRQNGNAWFVGEAYLTLAKCYLMREAASMAMEHLDKSQRYFMECQDLVRLRDVYYLQSRLYNKLKVVHKRDECASRFVDVSRQLVKGALPVGLGDISNEEYMKDMIRRQVHRPELIGCL
ncbi:Anaphase-promoting complex subunit 5 [Fragilaria crotonensis]|nr:Anaphase-promoting complex subunit 5 [Fragilaria crotonensis]